MSGPAEAAGPAPAGRSRFDPFLLPSATSLRFALLMLAAAVAAMYVGLWYVPFLIVTDVLNRDVLASCAPQARSAAGSVPDTEVLTGFLSCLRGPELAVLAMMVAAAPAWALLTLAVYAAYPALLRRRLRPDHVSASGAGGGDHDARLAVAELRAVLGGSRRWTLLLTRGTAGGARTFGAFGRYWIAIDRSMLAAGRDGTQLGARCATVIRHEAAHVRNRDVDITYLTVAGWWALLVLLLLPILGYLTVSTTITGIGAFLGFVVDVIGPLLIVVPLLGLLQLARARVLRTREHYADIRAAAAERTRAAFDDLLRPPPGRRRAPSLWRRVRSYHPQPADRLAVLGAQWRLARVEWVDVLVAGLVLGVSQLHLGQAGTLLTQGDAFLGQPPVAVLLSVPVGVVVAAMVWNAVHASVLDRRHMRWTAAVLAAGFLLGQEFPHLYAYQGADGLASQPMAALVSVPLLWLVCLAYLRWTAMAARLWLPAVVGRRGAYALALAGAGVVFGCSFATWVVFDGILRAELSRGPFAVGAGVFTASQAWPFFVAVGVAGVFVLAAPWRDTSRHLMVAVGVGIGLAALYAGLLTGASGAILYRAEPLPPGRGSLVVAVVGALALLGAAVVSSLLGAVLGGRRGARGLLSCTAAVTAMVTGFLEPLAFHTSLGMVGCLGGGLTVSCWAGRGNQAVAAYTGGEGLAIYAVPALLAVCWAGCMAGLAVRRWVSRRAEASEESPTAIRRRAPHVMAVCMVVLATAAVTAMSVVPLSGGLTAPRGAERAELRARVEPETVSRAETCQRVSTAQEKHFVGYTHEGNLAVLVPLASSEDPALAAFGTAMIEGAPVDWSTFIRGVDRYCDDSTG